MLKPHVAAALLVLTFAGVSAQQPADQPVPGQPAPTFRSEVNYVQLPVRVVDGRGNFVSGLTQADFQILEDGRPQKIATFSAVDIPNIPADSMVPDAPLDVLDPVASNERLDVDGRIYLFVLDDFHLEASYTPHVRRLMRGFINEHLSANDLAAVVIASGARSQDFTRNRRLLLEAADRFTAEFDPADPPELRRFQQDAVIRTLLTTTEWMGAIKGRRKALVLVTPTIGCAAVSFTGTGCSADLVDIVRSAVRSDVSVFGIDPRGLVASTGMGADYPGRRMPSRDVASLGLSSLQTAETGPVGSLRFLSENTGGFATVNTNNLEGALQRIVRENSAYYLIGYYSTNTATDGKFRKHEVKVSRRGMEVSHRPGYLGPRAEAAPSVAGPGSLGLELRELMKSPLPTTGMVLRFAAAPFLGPDGTSSVSVVVEMPRETLQFNEEGGRQRIAIGVYIGLQDRDGRAVGSDDPNINLDFPIDAGRRVTANGVRISSRIAAPPGEYHLWVGGAQSPGGLRGSAMTEIAIPDFRRGPLMLSGLAVTASTDVRMYNARADHLIDEVLGAAPVAHREFAAAGDLWIYGELYDNRSDAGEATISVSVKSADGKTVFEAPLEPAPVQFGQLARIPLGDLGPGSYVATVTARSDTPKPVSDSRTLAFKVK